MSGERGPRLHLHLLAFVTLALLLTFSGSCADNFYSRAYHDHVRQEVEGYRHHASEAELRRDVEAFLRERGRVCVTTPDGAIETEPESMALDHRARVRVELERQLHGVRVRFLQIVEEAVSPKQWQLVELERERELERQLQELLGGEPGEPSEDAPVVYTQPVDQLWEKLRGLAFWEHEMAISLPPKPVVDQLVTSEWNQSQDQRVRLEVQLRRHSSGGHSVEIQRRTERVTDERAWREFARDPDIDLELAFLRHRDPAAAEQLEAEAKQAGSAAYDKAVRLGACTCQ